MRTRWKKTFIVYTLLSIILGSNVLNLHALSHEEEPTGSVDCELCIFLTQSELNHAVLQSPPSFKLKVHEHFSGDQLEGYSYLIPKELVVASVFCRPPPSLS